MGFKKKNLTCAESLEASGGPQPPVWGLICLYHHCLYLKPIEPIPHNLTKYSVTFRHSSLIFSIKEAAMFRRTVWHCCTRCKVNSRQEFSLYNLYVLMFVASFRAANSLVGKSECSLSLDFLGRFLQCCLLLKVSNILKISLSRFSTSLTLIMLTWRIG